LVDAVDLSSVRGHGTMSWWPQAAGAR